MNNEQMPFLFSDVPPTEDRNTHFVAEMPAGLDSKARVLAALEQGLLLPGYFGRNWDALDECVNDFHWIQQRHIVLFHQDLPPLERRDLRIYLSILGDAVDHWRKETDHTFTVIFPLKATTGIEIAVCKE